MSAVVPARHVEQQPPRESKLAKLAKLRVMAQAGSASERPGRRPVSALLLEARCVKKWQWEEEAGANIAPCVLPRVSHTAAHHPTLGSLHHCL